MSFFGPDKCQCTNDWICGKCYAGSPEPNKYSPLYVKSSEEGYINKLLEKISELEKEIKKIQEKIK